MQSKNYHYASRGTVISHRGHIGRRGRQEKRSGGVVTAPNGVTTTIIVTVGSVSGGGLMNPNPQPAAHAAAVTAVAPTGAAPPVAQPRRR